MTSQKSVPTSIDREQILGLALDRVALIFGVDSADLRCDHVFVTDLQASVVSDFKRNEFDRIHSDILDVTDKSTLQEIKSGRLVINTVGDYCDHMAKCYATNEKEVCLLLEICQ